MNRFGHLTITLIVVAVQHHCMVAEACAREYQGSAKEMIESFPFVILEASTYKAPGLQCFVVKRPHGEPGSGARLFYFLDSMVNGKLDRGLVVEVKPYNEVVAASVYSEPGDSDDHVTIEFVPLFVNNGNCVVGELGKNSGLYALLRNVDAPKEACEPCMKKMNECSKEDVMFFNKGEDCSGVINEMKKRHGR